MKSVLTQIITDLQQLAQQAPSYSERVAYLISTNLVENYLHDIN